MNDIEDQKKTIENAISGIVNSLKGDNDKKTHIEGPGSFVVPQGRKSINSTTIIRRVWDQSAINLFVVISVFFAVAVFVNYVFLISKNLELNSVVYPTFGDAIKANPGLGTIFLGPLVCFALMYRFLVRIVNRSVFQVVNRDVIIQRLPLPWSGQYRKYSHEHLTQFYVKKVFEGENGYSYSVIAQFNNGPEQVIENRFDNYADAKILEQWLEEKLGIKDQSVTGEVGT